MRRLLLPAIIVVLISLVYYTYMQRTDVLAEVEFNSFSTISDDELDLRTRMDLAMEQEFHRTKDLLLNRVPRERLMEAYEVIFEQERRQGKAAISGITWEERGPNNVGGRTRVIMFDANDATNRTVWAGSVSGGLFKTTDIFASEVEWEPVNDFFGNMAVTALAQDPTDPDIMYFGTGEGYFNADAVRGDGIWKSTDGGDSWSQLASTTGNDFDYINKIIVDGDGNVIVGTRGSYTNTGGVLRSTDKGTSFTQVLERYTATSGAEYDWCADVELAADSSTFYASFGIFSTDGIFKSTDSAKTWSQVYDANANNEQRIDLVCAPSNSDYVYALVQGSGYGIGKIMKTTNGGSSWSTCTTISWLDQCSSSSSDFTRSQAWYNLASVVDPDDEDVLYVGGINLFRTTDGGSNWSQLSSWVGCGGYSEVHSDHHVLLFYPGSSDTMLNGNDGGIYITENAQASPPTWEMINSGFNVTQFYAGAIHPEALNPYFLTGSQDNGSQRFQDAGVNSTDEVTGGDGGFCHIDQENPDTQLTAYTYNNIRISTDGFTSYSSYSSSKGNFINASDYDSDNKILYAGSDAGYLYRWSNIGGTPSATNISISAMNSSQASAILVSPSTPTTVYVGTEGGRVVKVTSANSSPSGSNISTSLPSGTVSCIAEDPFDASHLLVTYSNYGLTSVYETTNGGTSWSSVEGNLPDMPIRWALFSPWGGDSALLATELGVWSTTDLNGGSTNWAATNTGLANCRVDMLQYRDSDSLIVAATHGRGLYTTKFFSERVIADFGFDPVVAYEGDEVQFYDDSYGATSWSWDFDNDGNAESTSQNPTFTFGEGGNYTVKLTINGTDSTTKSIHVLPKLGIPYTTSDGGDMESNEWHFAGIVVSGADQLWERGTPSNSFNSSDYNGSNAWVTDLDGDMYDADVECALLTPSFNFLESGTYTLSFVKSMEVQFCNGPLAAVVEYSTDGGYTWNLLGTDQTGTNWYNRGPNSSCQISTYIFDHEMGFVGNWSKETTSHDVSSLAGNSDVRFRFLYEVSDNFSNGYARDGLLIDDFAISGPSNDPVPGAGIETTAVSRVQNLGSQDSAHFYSSNGKLIASIWNLSTHDFGATTVEIDATGTGASDFDNNTAANQKIFNKTIKITPTSNNTNASVQIAMYFTADELSGWKSASGIGASEVQLFKTTNAIGSSTAAQGTYPTTTTIDSTYADGNNLCVISTFTNGFSGVGAGGGGGGSGPGPLPVELISFTGNREEKSVVLKWETAAELNNDRFEVLRSQNSGDFIAIGQVKGVGTSSERQTYSFTDFNITKNDYVCYQLRQVDFDGTRDYSNVVCFEAIERQLDVEIGPNPVRDELVIKLNPWLSDQYTIELIGIDGKTIDNYPVRLLEETVLDIRSLRTGAYFATIRRGTEIIHVEKIIKSGR